jgi:hypothetical protein
MGLFFNYFFQKLQHKNISAQGSNGYSTTIGSISTTYLRKIYTSIIDKNLIGENEPWRPSYGHDSQLYVNVSLRIMDKETKMSSNQKKRKLKNNSSNYT